MGERYKVVEDGQYYSVTGPHRTYGGEGWFMAQRCSLSDASLIARALNLLDAAERKNEAAHNPEDDGA